MRKMFSKNQIEEIAKTMAKQHGFQIGKYYLYDGVNTKVVDLVPEDYTGIAFEFSDEGLYIIYFEEGQENSYAYIATNSIAFGTSAGEVSYGMDGASRLNFANLTHSFNELDETLQQIIEDAISTGTASCTQAQWNVIKALLDKSLYLNYDGTSMIKSNTNGIDNYLFGVAIPEQTGSAFEIGFGAEASTLFAYYYVI